MLEILYEDEYIIAINKPPGILVHKTWISEDKVFLLQMLRDQLGYRPYTIHRLDRGTSGVILFAKSQEMSGKFSELFMEHKIEKKYLAIVRGWLQDEDIINYPLSDPESGKHEKLEASTAYRCLAKSEINAAIGLKYKTARFSLIEAIPKTGRRHQIRKHFAHIDHPIIGDKRHGDVKHNTYFREHFEIGRMCLHASELQFIHPISLNLISIKAVHNDEFNNALKITDLHL
jgi:tRNA pseudouridine65 synthase